MAFWQWSTTPGTNQTADPTINWAEGQPPSSVNDSARAMMARLAEWRNDFGSAGVTTGTSTAYALASSQSFPATPPQQCKVSFIAHIDSGLNPTLSVDGGTAYPIVDSNGGRAISPGALANAVLYTVTFLGAGWFLNNPLSHSYFAVPIGGMMDYTAPTIASSNFIFPYGQAISRTAYNEYFNLVGTRYGAGDGSTTFNVPDVRGCLTAALDNLGGASAGRLTLIGGGTTIGAMGGSQSVNISVNNLPNYTLTGNGVSVSVSGTTGNMTENASHYHNVSGTTTGQSNSHTHLFDSTIIATPVVVQADVTRPTATVNPTTSQVDTGYADQDHTHGFNVNSSTTSIDHTHAFSGAGSTSTLSVSSGGGNQALSILPPIITLPRILRII